VKNKKGFTMIEIIGAIIIMGVLLLLIIPGISKLMAKFRNDYYEKTEDSVNEAGKDFFLDNKIYLPDGLLESTYVPIGSLIENKYLEELVDYRGNSCSLEDKESYVIAINRGDGKYEYKTCISCKDDGYETDKNGTYCDSVWLTEGTISYTYCNNCVDPNEKDEIQNDCNKDLYFYYGTTREEIREKLFKRLSIVRTDKPGVDGNPIASICVGEKTKEEEILPTNIDIINNEPDLFNEKGKNYKTFEMTYGSDLNNNVINDNNVTIYKYLSPKVTMETTGGDEYYGSWTNQNVIIKLELDKNDEMLSLINADSSVEYQYSVNDGAWETAPCGMIGSDDSCSFTVYCDYDDYLTNSYKFRLIINKENISFESGYYAINIDKIYPSVSVVTIQNVEKELVTDEETKETKVEIKQKGKIKITASDSHSGIRYTDISGGIGTIYYQTSMIYEFEDEISLSATTCDKAGNCTSDSDSVSSSTEDNTTSYCTITYIANGGSSGSSSETVECDNQVKLPTASRSDYEFKGWYTSASGGSSVGSAGDSYTVTTNITVYAQWTENNTYTIIYNSNGDSCKSGSNCVTSTKCTVGDDCRLETNNYKMANYHVSYGWSTKANPGKNDLKYSSGGTYKFNANPNDVITLYSYYECAYEARSNDENLKVRYLSSGESTWPWQYITILDKELGTFKTKTGYGCIALGYLQTCITEEQVKSGIWSAHLVTCRYCGANQIVDGIYYNWCPVHGAAAGRDVCDAETKTYSSSTCKRGVAERWSTI